MRIFQVAVSTLISSVADGFGLQFFDFDFGDAVAFDRLNRVTMALVIETLTLSRDSLQNVAATFFMLPQRDLPLTFK